jgi:hypothetical protein
MFGRTRTRAAVAVPRRSGVLPAKGGSSMQARGGIMKRATTILLLGALALGAGAASPAWARHFHHGGSHVGVYIGPGWGWYAPPPVYYGYGYRYVYPPVVVTPAAPPVYIEQSPPESAAGPETSSGDWYYCSNPDGYYPYVKECPGGWRRVAPMPPPPNR